ncbi:MAG: DNA-directed RNA polymerase subunit H [Thermoprotei archaeon]|nr:MAG: DNA-directed RNA polymerase subunit H [Thermoprotei archaeon]
MGDGTNLKKVDVLKHVLVPQHILLDRQEAKMILKKLKIRPSQLPWILTSDPVVKRLDAKPGDIIMIIRESPTAGKVVTFRVVMPG